MRHPLGWSKASTLTFLQSETPIPFPLRNVTRGQVDRILSKVRRRQRSSRGFVEAKYARGYSVVRRTMNIFYTSNYTLDELRPSHRHNTTKVLLHDEHFLLLLSSKFKPIQDLSPDHPKWPGERLFLFVHALVEEVSSQSLSGGYITNVVYHFVSKVFAPAFCAGFIRETEFARITPWYRSLAIPAPATPAPTTLIPAPAPASTRAPSPAPAFSSTPSHTPALTSRTSSEEACGSGSQPAQAPPSPQPSPRRSSSRLSPSHAPISAHSEDLSSPPASNTDADASPLTATSASTRPSLLSSLTNSGSTSRIADLTPLTTLTGDHPPLVSGLSVPSSSSYKAESSLGADFTRSGIVIVHRFTPIPLILNKSDPSLTLAKSPPPTVNAPSVPVQPPPLIPAKINYRHLAETSSRPIPNPKKRKFGDDVTNAHGPSKRGRHGASASRDRA